jgi:hypothetical protein
VAEFRISLFYYFFLFVTIVLWLYIQFASFSLFSSSFFYWLSPWLPGRITTFNTLICGCSFDFRGSSSRTLPIFIFSFLHTSSDQFSIRSFNLDQFSMVFLHLPSSWLWWRSSRILHLEQSDFLQNRLELSTVTAGDGITSSFKLSILHHSTVLLRVVFHKVFEVFFESFQNLHLRKFP